MRTSTSEAAVVEPLPTRVLAQRSSAIDAVRVLATATVVMAHAFSDHPWTHHVLFTWHVPVFCILSGYLWSRRRTLRAEADRRVRSLLVPYVTWLVLVTAVWWAVSEHRGRDLGPDFLTDVLQGGTAIVMPYSQYWFITALFFACLYARVLGMLVRGPWLIGAVGVLGLVATTWWPDEVRSVWLAAGLAVPCLAFLAVGIALRDLRGRIRRPFAVGFGALLAGVLLIAAGIEPLDLKQGDLGTPGLTVLAGSLIAVGLILVSEAAFTGRLHHVPALSVLATAAMPVVLGHTLVLGVLADRPLDSPPWVFVVALTAPWILGLLVARVPAARTALLGA